MQNPKLQQFCCILISTNFFSGATDMTKEVGRRQIEQFCWKNFKNFNLLLNFVLWNRTIETEILK